MAVKTSTSQTSRSAKPLSRSDAARSVPARGIHARAAKQRPFLITTEQYLKMANLGFFQERRVELIEGRIIEMAPMNEPHWGMIATLPDILRDALPDNFGVGIQIPLPLGEGNEPEPDFIVYRKPQSGRIRKDNALEHTVLVIEISDATLAYDRTVKAALYAKANIGEYWIVNLKAREIEVLREPHEGKYGRKQVLKESESVAPLAAPDARIAVKQLLP